MINENPSNKNYWYGSCEDYEARCQRRLQHDLGIDEAAAETILHLRKLVVELQSHIRQLKIELDAHYENKYAHLTHYREVYFEATWIESDSQE